MNLFTSDRFTLKLSLWIPSTLNPTWHTFYGHLHRCFWILNLPVPEKWWASLAWCILKSISVFRCCTTKNTWIEAFWVKKRRRREINLQETSSIPVYPGQEYYETNFKCSIEQTAKHVNSYWIQIEWNSTFSIQYLSNYR